MEHVLLTLLGLSFIFISVLAGFVGRLCRRLKKLENNVFYTLDEMDEIFKTTGLYWVSECKLASSVELEKVAERLGLLINHLNLRYEQSNAISPKFVKKSLTRKTSGK